MSAKNAKFSFKICLFYGWSNWTRNLKDQFFFQSIVNGLNGGMLAPAPKPVEKESKMFRGEN